MMDTHSLDLAIGSLMGLAYIAAPGPVNVETLRQELSRGWQTALPLAITLARSLLQGRAQGWISSTCGLALILFGCLLGHRLLAV
jgi:threonine/homoserine/homoserine lactone efflux protein